jgi:hypothetical protein
MPHPERPFKTRQARDVFWPQSASYVLVADIYCKTPRLYGVL